LRSDDTGRNDSKNGDDGEERRRNEVANRSWKLKLLLKNVVVVDQMTSCVASVVVRSRQNARLP